MPDDDRADGADSWPRRYADDAGEARHRRARRRPEPDFDDELPERGGWSDRRALRGEGLSEERVARILDDAFDSMQQTLRANERRTAHALESLERRLGASQQGRGGRPRGAPAPQEREPQGRHGEPALPKSLEDRLSNVVSLIEERARADEQRQPPGATDLRTGNRAVERQIAALNERIEALAGQLTERAQRRDGHDARGSIEKLQQEIQRMGAAQRQAPAVDQRMDRVAQELAALRTSLGRQQPPDAALSALERRFESLGERLDAIADKIAGLRVGGARDLRAQQGADAAFAELKDLIRASAAPAVDDRVLTAIEALERRLDALAQPPKAMADTYVRIQSIDRKLDSLQRTPPDLAAKLSQLDKIETLERKLDALQNGPDRISERLDDIRALVSDRPQPGASLPGVEKALGAVVARLETLQPHAPASVPGEQAFARLHADIQTIARKLESAPRETDAGFADPDTADRMRAIDAKLDALQAAPLDLAHRLDRLQDVLLTQTPAVLPMPAGVETLLRNLALRLESMQTAVADEAALDRLHDEIRAISRKLESSPGAQDLPGIADIGGLERSVSALFGQIEDLRADLGSTAEQAARAAAAAVLDRLPDAAPIPAGDAVLRQLDDMQAAQAEADRRQHLTLGAVHETLKRVVDRLVEIEDDIKVKPAAPPPSGPPAGPVTTAPLPPLGADPLEAPLGAGHPMSVAGLRAQRLGVAAPAAQPEAAKPGLGAMLAAARGAVSNVRLPTSKTKPAAAAEPMPPPIPSADAREQPSAASGLDMPLEPGSGRPRPGHAPILDSNDPKAHFLAAARRAAQAAAEQSAAALGEAQPAKGKAKAAPRRSLSKKQVILLGLAALVVAVGATLQIMRAPPAVPDAPAQRLSNLDRLLGRQAESEPARSAQAAPTPAPRQIVGQALPQTLPQAAAPAAQREAALPSAKPDDRVTSQAARSAAPGAASLPPDPTMVGSIGAEPPKPSDALPLSPQPAPQPPADPLLRFDGVTGAERLKAAARAGDVAAYIELGTRHLEGRGAPRDAKIAAQWFERAAEQGSAPARFRLGAMHREGRGLDRDPKTALRHFQAAAEAGNARAMYNAAVLLAEGVNGGPDYAGAAEWFKKAAEFGIRDSQYNLAILYARGLGVGQDLAASYAWFSAAAASGDEDAAKKRDEVAARLEPAKLAQAKAAAGAWKPKTPDPASNEVSVPPGGWDSAGAKQVPAAAMPSARR